MLIHIIDKKDVIFTDILSKYITLKMKISDKEKNILVLRCDKLRFYEIEDIEYENEGYSIVTARPSLDIDDGITVCQMMIFDEFAKNFNNQGQATKECSSELKELVSVVVNDVIDKQQCLTQKEIKTLKNIIFASNYENENDFLNITQIMQKIINQYNEKEKIIYKKIAKELITKRKTRLINLICACKINRLDYDKLHQAVETEGVCVDYRIRKKRGSNLKKWENN